MFNGKFRRPLYAGCYIKRTRLLEKLETFSKLPLTIVSAPAGYGKTTLINSWAESVSVPVVWLSLDDNDNDLQTFISYLVVAVRTAFPNALPKSSAFGGVFLSPPFDTMSQCMVNELDAIGHEFVLILDNYELIHDRQVHELLDLLLKYPAPQVHIIISTRYEPPLTIAGLRARNLLGEITVNDLLFSLQEAGALLNAALPGQIDDARLQEIYREMEGWTAGLSLYATAMAHTNEKARMDSAHNSALRYIKDYLSSQVLSRITEPSRNLLYRVSIPNELCEGLLDALFQDSAQTTTFTSGHNFLKRMERENLFIFAAGTNHGWYRLHPAFREVLRSFLEENYTPEEIERLHIAAAYWLGGRGRFENALYHAGKIPVKTALRIFSIHRMAILELNTWRTMGQWLALFPSSLIDSQSDLLLAEAWLMLINLRLPEMVKLLDRVEIVLDASRNLLDTQKRAEVQILRAMFSVKTGDAAHAFEYLHSLEGIQPGGDFLKEAALAVRGDAYRLTGNMERWTEILRERMVFTTSLTDNGTSVSLLPSIYTLNMITGRLEDAEKAASLMLTISRKSNNRTYIGIACLYLGLVAYQKNEVQGAERYFLNALEMADFMDTERVVTCYLGLAAAHGALGEKSLARTATDNAKSYLTSIHSLDLLPYIETFDTELELRQGTQPHHNPVPLADWRLLLTDILYHPSLTFCRYLISSNPLEGHRIALPVLEELDERARSTGNVLLRIGVMAQTALAIDINKSPEQARECLKTALHLAEYGGYLRVFLDLGTSMARLLRWSGLPQTGILAALLDAFTRESLYITENITNIIMEHLTEQELRVLGYLKQRFSNKEIADRLYITTATVKSHTIHIYQKLNVGGRREAVEKASRLGIFIA